MAKHADETAMVEELSVVLHSKANAGVTPLKRPANQRLVHTSKRQFGREIAAMAFVKRSCYFIGYIMWC